MEGDDYEKLKPVIDRIEAKMPKNWKVLERKEGEIPEHHYEGMEYGGPKGVYLFLIGDRDVNYYWKDQEGIWHKKPFSKEAIALWVMPPEYRQSWKRFFVFKGHVSTPKVYFSKDARVYGKAASFRDPDLPWRGFEEEFPNASTYVGSLPGERVQSWMHWKDDIEEALNALAIPSKTSKKEE